MKRTKYKLGCLMMFITALALDTLIGFVLYLVINRIVEHYE